MTIVTIFTIAVVVGVPLYMLVDMAVHEEVKKLKDRWKRKN